MRHLEPGINYSCMINLGNLFKEVIGQNTGWQILLSIYKCDIPKILVSVLNESHRQKRGCNH